ncbi:transcription antitermination protein NusB [Williamsoniiplasma somnilux]|uniref:Transcription antitermination protein NusB n=2 Tax=Williamsoniiplasma somnilux TaxID=215578 RepID=A0A2K8NZW6_9MOLU|nr:transcription antitermination protein NusB [Williamsoniiplasma somnilux]
MGVTKKRKILVQLFYRYLLMNNDNSYIIQDLLDETQLKNEEKINDEMMENIKVILKEKEDLIDEIAFKLSDDWNWDRIPFLIQAILLVGIFEIKYTQTPKAVTINEMINISKEFEPDFNYQFINAILDKIIKF